MLTALKPLSILNDTFRVGEVIPAAAQAALPPGRVEQLKAQRMVEEITDEAGVARHVVALEARIEALELQMSTHKHAGRPPREGS
ncbi:MAG: hypothetical protein ACT452_12010 [Microthrixaceae bacterium]